MATGAQEQKKAKDGVEELDDIINEIDMLQKEMDSAAATSPAAPAAPASASAAVVQEAPRLAAVPASEVIPPDAEVIPENVNADEILAEMATSEGSDEPWLDETLAQLRGKEETPPSLAKIPSALPPSASSELSMNVKGAMKIVLNFDGEILIVDYNTQNFSISLSDGIEFKVPVRSMASKKAA